jgi:hypothetical protein
MARQSNQTQPSQATPPEQALVTPATRPEVLLALQHQQAVQAFNSECAGIRQELGSLGARIDALKKDSATNSDDMKAIKRLHHIGIGIFIAVAFLLTVVWYFVGSKVGTLLMMADERQITDLHKMDEKSAPANSN